MISLFWADALVKDLSGPQRVSTGISPSGPIHVGNMREILTGDILFKAITKRGLESDFIYLCDDMDPLRKVYPFLSKDYERYVGQPLKNIPAPQGAGKYSDYYLEPFVRVMKEANIPARVIKTSDLYESGMLAQACDIAINNREKIKDILETVSGRKIEGDFYPYEPLCEKCGRISTTHVISYSYPYAEYACKCGHHGFADIRKAEGKMPWRVEWPAKWFALKVTVEPFGKDHGAPGGSYDTGRRIAREVFGIEPPVPLMYERIILKGKGAMHSSTGLAIAASEIMEVIPPDLLRYMIARVNPGRHIDFDPGMGILALSDELEKLQDAYFENRASLDEDQAAMVEYSLVNKDRKPYPVDFRHLVTLVQIYRTEDEILRAVKKGQPSDFIEADFRKEIEYARRWLERYAPESVKFRILPVDQKIELSDSDLAILSDFLNGIEDMPWNSESIHDRIYEISQKFKTNPESVFTLFYRVFIGKDRGPRLGYFLFNLGKDFVRERIRNVIRDH
ncbi:lysyl-tRNA synthetase (lysS) related protein [Thermoplasma acidophilum]|uniref:Lysine--tRNA ligase n=1 Tax=Thermoplasma acidophilum (strain ATCC 25905 / DSM 1728 / JCM 9062 / NBRC 15155 / AMRC-C165) TaxID=273075 RepID=SYK_THEAC|nr:lysine--tRNA ligase [Thermoplasma acidophilum]P57677.1 RecName: Full=Lysine--tRNA ligase; AltName: Full=Lysyl-tRNA synthetase; Short=LysRS [Thermoplasma acidophilum DSM 1728]CAC12288.1 lysyl-tRNA synthetase (lysS) related protein [Thermoplasma acidophilum]